MKIFIRYFILSLVFLFSASCVYDEMSECGMSGTSAIVNFKFSMADGSVKTRSSLEKEEERNLRDMYMIVFDASGKAEYKKAYEEADLRRAFKALNSSAADSHTYEGKLTVHLTTGVKTVCLIGNYKGLGIYNSLENEVKNINTLTEWKNLKAVSAYSSVRRPTDYLLMSAEKAVTVSAGGAAAEIKLKRLDAKVSFKINTGTGVEFIPNDMKIRNLPKSSYVSLHAKGNDGTGSWDAGGNDVTKYDSSRTYHFNKNSGNSIPEVVFYMPENRKNAKKLITGTGREAYNLRQKQIKRQAESGESSELVNLSPENAPDVATYIEFTGDYKKIENGKAVTYADLRYRIYLGYTSTTDPVNDYDIERNVYYIYNVTIDGVDDVKVEAQSGGTGTEVENAPGAEGEVYDLDKIYVLDCHYEQRLVELDHTRLGIFETNGNLKPGASISYRVSSPFGTKTVKWTAEQLEALDRADGTYDGKIDRKKIPADKRGDTEWVKFFIHNDPDDRTMKLYSDNTIRNSDFRSLEEFLHAIMSANPKASGSIFSRSTNKCYATMFVDEYFYEKDPIKEGAQKDPNLWKKFANADDRTLHIIVNSSVSPDGLSRYATSAISLRQMSIKTFFVESDNEIRAWGVENVDETPDLDWCFKAPGEAGGFYNKYHANGWSNTWKMMSYRSTSFTGNEMVYYGSLIQRPAKWSEYTLVKNNILSLNSAPSIRSDFAFFTPWLRNRDDNRDDKMQASECKWYIPSKAELSMLFVAQKALPASVRIYGRDNIPFGHKTIVYSSKAYMGATNGSLSSPNTMVLFGESGSFIPLLNYYNKTNYNITPTSVPGNRIPESNVRLIRDLGKLETGNTKVTSYHLSEIEGELRKMLKNKWTPEGYLTFDASCLSISAVRGIKAVGELPPHDENSEINDIYEKGFEVAKYIAHKKEYSDFPANKYTNAYTNSQYYNNIWTGLQQDIENGNSPCRYYYQNADASDRGTWRVPNASELKVMSENLFDWDKAYEANNIYDTTTNSVIKPFNFSYAMFFSRTGFSDERKIRSFNSGWAMYCNQCFRVVGTSEVIPFGQYFQTPSGPNPSTGYGLVRCVRDL